MCKEAAGSDQQLLIQIVTEKRDKRPTLGVSFNGSWPSFEAQPTDELLVPASIYTHHVAAHEAFNYRFPLSEICDGWNEVVVYNESHDGAVNVVSVELAVKDERT